jgi:hypothetical protein
VDLSPLNYPVRACVARGKAIGLSVVVSIKIARSRDVDTRATHKRIHRNRQKKLVSNRLVRPTSVVKTAFCWAYQLHPRVLSAHAHNLVYAGKGHQ